VTKDNLPPERRKKPLSSCVRSSLERYFRDLDGHKPGELYHMVMSEVERPLLESVMRFTEGNQTRAAEILGINRSTLRKKLEQYDIG
jgi:Fis family transcriptional regulator